MLLCIMAVLGEMVCLFEHNDLTLVCGAKKWSQSAWELASAHPSQLESIWNHHNVEGYPAAQVRCLVL